MWMFIFVENVDALYEEYQASGAIIRQKPTNFSWGVREMNIEDLVRRINSKNCQQSRQHRRHKA